jgi:RND superfamily putative drug exporter
MLARLADRMRRWRWTVIALWALLLVLGLAFGGRVYDNLSVEEDLGGGESARAQERLARLRPSGPELLALADGAPAADPAVRASVERAATALRRLDGVARVTHPSTVGGQGLAAADGRALLVRVELERDQPGDQPGGQPGGQRRRTQDAVVSELRSIRAPRVLVGGEPLVEQEFSRQAERDLLRGEEREQRGSATAEERSLAAMIRQGIDEWARRSEEIVPKIIDVAGSVLICEIEEWRSNGGD